MYINEEAAAAVVKSVAGNQYFIVPPGILSRRRRRFLGGQNSSASEKFCRSRSQALLDNGWDDEDEHEDGVEVFTVSSRQCSRTARICLRTWPSTFRFLRYLVEPYRHADRKMPTVRVFRLPFKANIPASRVEWTGSPLPELRRRRGMDYRIIRYLVIGVRGNSLGEGYLFSIIISSVSLAKV